MSEIILVNTPAKPIIKWVGGKTQIIDKLIPLFPKKITNYHEPFIGGASVLIAVLTNIEVTGHVFAYDLNSDLIALYKNIQSHPRGLIKELTLLQDSYTSHQNPEEFYYTIRELYNRSPKGSIKSSAMLVMLNKTCFRGLYRVGPKGFNVPFGNYKNPTILDAYNILALSELFKRVKFIHCCFTESLSRQDISPTDFVYLDPPYAPESETSFVKYNKEGFTLDNHLKLFNLIKTLKCKFVLSNANVKLVTDSFKDSTYKIDVLICKRAINSKDPSKNTEEVLIYNLV
jgi:DNA adenine methylase